jgi:hypothetical protein
VPLPVAAVLEAEVDVTTARVLAAARALTGQFTDTTSTHERGR